DPLLTRENTGKLDVIALHDQERVGKQTIDDARVPHQVPALLGLGLETVKLLAGHDEAMVVTKRHEVGDVAVQDFLERVLVQKADVIGLVKGVDENLPVHGLRDDALVIEGPGGKPEALKFGA